MIVKIVADSSSNLYTLDSEHYACVPLTIRCAGREFVDNMTLDTRKMLAFLNDSKERSSTSCPNVYDYLRAFEGADGIFVVTITSHLSGSYAAAMQAKTLYLERHPGAKVCVLDSLSAGPELHLLIDRLSLLIGQGLSFEQIESDIRAYHAQTHLVFSLQSLANLARNGRVKPSVAKIAGLLGIHLVGRASAEGELQPLHKARGRKKAYERIVEEMSLQRFASGRVIIAHCLNPDGAQELADRIRNTFPRCQIHIEACTGLCSFYAEMGGLMIGYEGCAGIVE